MANPNFKCYFSIKSYYNINFYVGSELTRTEYRDREQPAGYNTFPMYVYCIVIVRYSQYRSRR